MMSLSTTDLVLLTLIAAISVYYLFNRFYPKANQPSATSPSAYPNSNNPNPLEQLHQRDFIKKMELQKKKIVVFYGSQTGTAEDYATRLAKEAKSKFGFSSLVADPEEYDFDNLDQLTSEQLAVFVVATYGEGEPTDNAVAMVDFLKSSSMDLSQLRYIVFALGNRTYEQFCAMGKIIDGELSKRGGIRLGELGMGDDDKSMEEDYLAWKDLMWEEVSKSMGWEEGRGSDEPDFNVTELTNTAVGPQSEVEEAKIYRGELSSRALAGTRGVFDSKNPYPSPIVSSRQLFSGGNRDCVHTEFDIKDTGIRYHAGDHLAVWPINSDREVERLMRILGLWDKRDTGVEISSLDSMLAKVPFPSPASYDAIFRHYLDISSTVSRQLLLSLSKFAPNVQSKEKLQALGSNKELYLEQVGSDGLRLGEVLLKVSEDELDDRSSKADDWHLVNGSGLLAGSITKQWDIPFDRIISGLPRLQPRFYSISSSSKLYPDRIHITAVVLKFPAGDRMFYGCGTNYLLNAKMFIHSEEHESTGGTDDQTPKYKMEGPRGKYLETEPRSIKIPIHVRRSNFRLPTSPKIPVIMIGPGTGVAPFRAFVQERVALARKTKAKVEESLAGTEGTVTNGYLKDWAKMVLFYGCRRADEDFLYKDEWGRYSEELDGKFEMFTAISRDPELADKKKRYVQDLMKERKEMIKTIIIDQKGYLFICGDGKNMSKGVEEVLKEILDGFGLNGAKELKFLKDRNRMMLDVWS